MPTEADTCRQFVVPRLQAAGRDSDVQPVDTHSLRQGITDSFLAPYRVHGTVARWDATDWRPSKDEVDRNGRPIPDEEDPGKADITQFLDSLLKSPRDILRKDEGLNGDVDRLPLLIWVMFLKFLDDPEIRREQEAKLAGKKFKPAFENLYRWRDWAARIVQRLGFPGGSISALFP